MMRQCDVCGKEIEATAGVCQGCGMVYVAEDSVDKVSYDSPRWGAITVILSLLDKEEQEVVARQISDEWRFLEDKTSQKLFAEQLSNRRIGSEPVTLFGPYASFLAIKNKLAAFGDSAFIKFDDMPIAEIYKIRDR